MLSYPSEASSSCNCQYGPQDPRCCIARARRRELEEAWRLGREGKPLPPEDKPIPLFKWELGGD